MRQTVQRAVQRLHGVPLMTLDKRREKQDVPVIRECENDADQVFALGSQFIERLVTLDAHLHRLRFMMFTIIILLLRQYGSMQTA